MPSSAALRAARAPLGRAAAVWHCWYDERPRPGALNMAIDEALLARAGRLGERWLRLYRWEPHCLSFGRHEPASRRYDRRAIEARGMDVVRRPTGGRAVWHARELTYAVALPAEAIPGGPRAAYAEIHGVLRDAMRSLGVPADLAGPAAAPSLGAGACFARPVGGEIVVAGRKVVGSAQLRLGGGLLQHGSMLLQDDQAAVDAVTCGVAPADSAGPREPLFATPVREGELAAAVARAAAARWRGDWRPYDPDPALLGTAAERRAHYESAAWTWRA